MDDGEKRLTIPKGAIFIISAGAYSDYGVMGVFRATKRISTKVYIAAYIKEHPDQEKSPDEKMFLGWLARAGVLEPVDTFEWHLGASYDAEFNYEVERAEPIEDYDSLLAKKNALKARLAQWEAEAPIRAAAVAKREEERRALSAFLEASIAQGHPLVGPPLPANEDLDGFLIRTASKE